MESQAIGLMHFWQAGDAVTHAVAYILLAMSVLSWYFILSRALTAWRLRRNARKALDEFWSSHSLDEALARVRKRDRDGVFGPLAERAIATAQAPRDRSLVGGNVDLGEAITRALRRDINQASSRLESGLTFLASVGSTAPFVGLFGTVWGIYHALLAIASTGQVMIDKIAGPVGEALVMTAAGLAVAIPAVLAYNALTRSNRVILAELDGFAHDLLALLTTGSRDSGARAGTDALRTGAAAAPVRMTQPVGS